MARARAFNTSVSRPHAAAGFLNPLVLIKKEGRQPGRTAEPLPGLTEFYLLGGFSRR